MTITSLFGEKFSDDYKSHLEKQRNKNNKCHFFNCKALKTFPLKSHYRE